MKRSPPLRELDLTFLEALLAEPAKPASPRLDKLAGRLRATGATGLARMRFDEAMLAAWLGREDLLASVGPACDPTATSRNGTTALHLAAESGSLRCVELLLGRWDPRAKTGRDGEDSLMIAIIAGHLDSARRLAPLADPRSIDFHGRTALHHAAHMCPAACAMLMAHWDLNALDHQRRNAAMVAIEWRKDSESLRLLLPKTDLAARLQNGLTLRAAALRLANDPERIYWDGRDAVLQAIALIDAEELSRELSHRATRISLASTRL